MKNKSEIRNNQFLQISISFYQFLLLKLILIIIWGTFFCFSYTLCNATGPGTYIGTLFKLPSSARTAALGNTFGGIIDDVNVFRWNPAALAQIRRIQISALYSKLINEMNYGVISSALPITVPVIPGTFGINVLYLDQGKTLETDINGTYSGKELWANELSLCFSYALCIKSIVNVGTNFKILYNTLGEENASSIALDLGIVMPLKEILNTEILKKLNLGISLQNVIATQFVYIIEREPLFKNYIFSIGGQIINKLNVGMDINILSSAKKPKINFGIEYLVKELSIIPIVLRAGYFYSQDNKYSKTLGITAGVGIMFKSVEIGYAYIPNGIFGETHYISLMYTVLSPK